MSHAPPCIRHCLRDFSMPERWKSPSSRFTRSPLLECSACHSTHRVRHRVLAHQRHTRCFWKTDWIIQAQCPEAIRPEVRSMETTTVYNRATLTSHQNQSNTMYLLLQYDPPEEQPPPLSMAILSGISGDLGYGHLGAFINILYPYLIGIDCEITS